MKNFSKPEKEPGGAGQGSVLLRMSDFRRWPRRAV
jgi:hypothetical protein